MGGWNTTITQDTTLTPMVVKQAIGEFLYFIDKFNDWLEDDDIKPIRKIGPMGSTYYCFKEDLKNNPSRIYGDVDYLVCFPYIGKWQNEPYRDYENRCIKFYKDKLQEFFKNPPNNCIGVSIVRDEILDVQEKYVVVETSKGPVQIDLLVALPDYSDWMAQRYVPPKNMKGVVLGSLFSAINHTYSIMIGDRGVVIRIQDGKLVQRKRKNVDIRTVTLNYSELWVDMFFYLAGFILKDGVQLDNYYLEKYRGIDTKNNNNILEDACFGLVGFFQMLESVGALGNDIFPEKTANECLKKISDEYLEVTWKQMNHPKFDKAETYKAKASAEKFKEDVLIGRDVVTRILSI